LDRIFDSRFVVNPDTDLVTITIGGNDLGFRTIIEECVKFACDTEPRFEGKTKTLQEWVPGALADLEAHLSSLFSQIRSLARNASVLVLEYPYVVADPADHGFQQCPSLDSIIVDTLYEGEISPAEQLIIRDDVVDGLNATIRAAAVEAGVHVVALGNEFAGREICGSSGDEWFNGLNDFRVFDPGQGHPNVKGHDAYAKAVNTFLAVNQQSPPNGLLLNGLPANPDPLAGVSGLTTPQGVSPAGSLGELGVESAFALPCPARNTYIPGQVIRVIGVGFKPRTAVQVEVVAAGGTFNAFLGSATSDSEGNLDATVSLPAVIPSPIAVSVDARGASPNSAERLLTATILIQPSFDDDVDQDGIPDACDTCPDVFGSYQGDADADGLGDICDVCPNDYANDLDGDGVCAPADSCPSDPLNDVDGDGHCAAQDNCPGVANPAQVDTDGDGKGNACDGDLDGDGAVGTLDSAVFTQCYGLATGLGMGPSDDPTCEESDMNSDGMVDDLDFGLLRLLFDAPGADWDGDGIPDDGDGTGTAGDGPCPNGVTLACDDNCRYRANPGQGDADGDGGGDACRCGDMNGNGMVDGPDLTLYKRHFGGLASPFSTDRCGVSPAADGGTCDGADLTVIKRFFGGLPPGIANTCAAYLGP
jgi:hypothetical protein